MRLARTILRNTLAAFFFITLALVGVAGARQRARPAPYGLPPGARVLETQPLELGGAKKRALVLWMLRPTRHPRDESETYTCPEETRGSFYQGPARLSLVDTNAGRVVNTLRIIHDSADADDTFDIPYRIHAGSYYHVEGSPEGREGRPTIMRLRDLNGDGRPFEFALFDAWACMGLETALFGYSERQDRVIQYPVHLEVTGGGKKTAQVQRWVDYLFSREPVGPGRWQYEIDYRGRGGSLDRYEVRYNREAERFEGSVNYVSGQ